MFCSWRQLPALLESPATEVLRRLEDVRSAEEAQEAAQAFRAWISGMVGDAEWYLHKVSCVRQIEESLG